MLTKLIRHWNPFNLYGIEVDIEDLICNPLKSNETLRQDYRGHCKRIQAPSIHSSNWEKFVFWLQIHLNEKGHLEAIDKMISLFHEKLLKDPPQVIEQLQKFNFQADKLRSLKNDYGFVYLKQGDAYFIELRLNEIKQHAYSIFADHHGKQAHAEEEARRLAFLMFVTQMEQKLEELDISYSEGLRKARLMLIASSHYLQMLFEERVQSLQNRFKIIQELESQINEVEMKYKGKFTIPSADEYFYRLRARVCHEVRKIGIEAESVIENLIINYRIGPFKEEIKLLLFSVEIDPDTIQEVDRDLNKTPFCEELQDEIHRIQTHFKSFLI